MDPLLGSNNRKQITYKLYSLLQLALECVELMVASMVELSGLAELSGADCNHHRLNTPFVARRPSLNSDRMLLHRK